YFLLFFSRPPPPPALTPFPYTTLFRSPGDGFALAVGVGSEVHRARGRHLLLQRGDQLLAIVEQPIGRLPAAFDIDAEAGLRQVTDRKSTRLNSSHVSISYAVFCLKKKK